MMGWGYRGMMGGGSVLLGTLTWLVVFLDLVLLAIYLLKKIQK